MTMSQLLKRPGLPYLSFPSKAGISTVPGSFAVPCAQVAEKCNQQLRRMAMDGNYPR